MSKQKRMIYVYEENLDFYDNLENKSQFFNDALQDARVNTRLKAPKGPGPVPTAPEVARPDTINGTPIGEKAIPDVPIVSDPRIQQTRDQIAAMDARDAERLRQARGQ